MNLIPKTKITSLYKDGYSCPQIGKMFGVSKTCIRDILIKNQIMLRPPTLSHRKYKINEHYFDKIDKKKRHTF